MMNYLLRMVSIFAILISDTFAIECKVTRDLVLEDNRIKLCYDKEQDHYLSTTCNGIKECFFKKSIKLQFYANQSPGFSLCYQLGGRAFFGDVINQQMKVPMCELGGHFIDQENLMKVYFADTQAD